MCVPECQCVCVSPCRVNLCVCPFAEESHYVYINFVCVHVCCVCV